MISLARIRLRYRTQNPAYAGCRLAAKLEGFVIAGAAKPLARNLIARVGQNGPVERMNRERPPTSGADSPAKVTVRLARAELFELVESKFRQSDPRFV
jgi:hypothetical protein